jgi:CheY-like chemotaxis protein
MSSTATSTPALRSVLVVDDHEGSLSALCRLLRLSGYEVHQAVSVHDALAASDREPCDVLISDIGLPDGSGVELMREMKARRLRDGRPLYGIALTGFTDECNVQACTDAGFGEFLPKPTAFEDVLAAIQRLTCPSPRQTPGAGAA